MMTERAEIPLTLAFLSAAKVCGMEGAFGCGIPIAGRAELEEWEKMKPKEVGG